MKTMRTIFKILILIIVLILIYWGYRQYYSRGKWREYNSLVKLYPRLKREKIESIAFCEAVTSDTGAIESESFLQEWIGDIIPRIRDAKAVDSWHLLFEVPKENLPECIKLFDKAFENVKPISSPWQAIRGFVPVLPSSKVKIVTDKGKYIFPVETDISGVNRGHVQGREWASSELGEFLYKIGFPSPEYKYELPAKEQTVAILISARGEFIYPPVAVFGDIKLAEKVIDIDKRAAEYIVGRPLGPKMVFEGRDWLEKIMSAYEVAYKQAEERNKGKIRAYYPGDPHNFDGKILFITRHELRGKRIGINEDVVYHEASQKGISISGNTVYDDYIKSNELKAFFDELGLTKELLAGEPNKASQN
jgi:hypothetical protein